ncbi:MAG TPA: carbohydrate porin, partial [Variovorax sp.]
RLRPSSGGYAVGETRIAGREDGAKRTVSAFVQLGLASAAANRFGSYVGAGLIGTGWIAGRESDQLGISAASVRNGSPYQAAQQAQGLLVSRTETVIELTYLTALASWLSVQPDLQYVRHPNTDLSLSNAWVVQLRFEVTF